MSFNTFLNYFRENFLLIFLLFLSLIINIGSVWYYFYKFNNLGVIIALILSLFLTYIFIYFSISKGNQQGLSSPSLSFPLLRHFVATAGTAACRVSFSMRSMKKLLRGKGIPELAEFLPNLSIFKIILPLITLTLFFILFQILFRSGSLSAIASPWHFLPNYFWIFLWVLTLVLFVNFYLKNKWSYLFMVMLYFLFFSISFFIYKIAFGYDQLLHQRAMSDILRFGLIEPKTIYYLGQYTLELFIFKIWPFSLETLDKLLVPFLSAVLIPLTFIFNFKKRGFHKTIWPLLLFLILPFSIFTYTVPQNLAFLFLIILLLFSFNKGFVENRFNFLFLFSLALAIFFIHPIAGVPAIIFTFILFISIIKNDESLLRIGKWNLKFNYKLLNVLKYLAYLAQIIILPILLIFSGGRFSIPNINLSSWAPRLVGQENVILNFIYFFGLNKNWWLLILFLLATIFIFKYRLKELKIFYFNSLALMLSYFLSLFIDFPFLSQIDKGSYAGRILILSFLFLLPVFYEIFICLIKKIKSEKIFFKIIILIFLSALLLASLYLNYPRKDNHFNSRAFSVSLADFEVVRLIEEIKENDNYIVLANQQVGASAIKEYSFKRYYGPWLYYSVQTGGLLYDHYLKMIEDPSGELMLGLMTEVGAEGVYFVVNDYWWGFDRIIEEARVKADEIYSVDDGRIIIFYFRP